MRRRWLSGLTALLLASLLAGPAAPMAAADSVRDKKNALDRQIAQLQDTLEGASQKLVNAAVSLKVSQARLVGARAALSAAQTRLAHAQQADADLASQVAFAEAEQAKGTRDLEAQQAAEDATRGTLGRIAREAYIDSGMGGLSVVLQASSPSQFADQVEVAGVALRAQNGAIDRLAAQQADMRARVAKLDALTAQVTELKRRSAIVVAQRRAAQTVAARAESQVAALVTQQTAAMTVIRGQVTTEKARIDALQVQQARLQAILAARARAAASAHHARATGEGAPPGRSSGFLSFPARGPITSGFGLRYHPILHIWRMHTGTDFGIPCGTPVYAAADGQVISAGWAGGYGNRIVIDHGWVDGVELATTYNHLSRIVRHGRVSRGELIAYSGTTGLSTGCHLHFETLVNGVYVNPMRWL